MRPPHQIGGLSTAAKETEGGRADHLGVSWRGGRRTGGRLAGLVQSLF
jgi:hypothetical protein